MAIAAVLFEAQSDVVVAVVELSEFRIIDVHDSDFLNSDVSCVRFFIFPKLETLKNRSIMNMKTRAET